MTDRRGGAWPVPRFVLALALVALAGAWSSGGSAGQEAADGAAHVSPPVRVAGPSPFAAGCEGMALNGRVYRGSAVEPMLAVDPRDPRHLVAAWVQDRIATAAASGVGGAVSRDGGLTWTPSTPAFSRCAGGTAATGGDYARASDPWVTIGPNGDVYAVVLAVNAFAGPETASAILVSRSTDGGLTWSDPLALDRDPIAGGFNDKPTIAADPFDARYVYAVWDRDFLADQTASGLVEAPVYFARTTDGGQTWEPPRVIHAAPGARTIGHVIVVLPSGELVNVFFHVQPSASGAPAHEIALIRSTDRGATWSAPVRVSDVVVAPLLDPYSTFPLQPDAALAVLPTVAVDPRSGRLHVAWQDGRFSAGDHIDIAYTTSADGGRTWSGPIRINQTPGDVPAFVPTIAVLPDGTVGVAYYDLRHATPLQHTILTDVWLAYCRVECADAARWLETHIAGPFDLARAPYGRGFFLGDYQGLAGTASGFLVLYAATPPPGGPGFADAYFVTVTLDSD